MFTRVGIIFASSGDGTGTSITGTLASSYTDGTRIAVAGVGPAKLRLRIGKGGATSFDVQVTDDSDSDIPGADEVPVLAEAQSTGLRLATTNYTASGEDVLLLDLGGTVERLIVRVRANGAGPLTADDFVFAELFLGGSVVAAS